MSIPNEVPKSFLHGYSKQDLVVIVNTTLEKAMHKHQEARRWEARALAAESELVTLKAAQALP